MPGGLDPETRHDVLDGHELQLSIWSGGVDETLGLLRVDLEIVDQLLVEVVVAHDPGRRVRDATGDDPFPGTVDVAELVAGRDRGVDAVELGRHLTNNRQVFLRRRRLDEAEHRHRAEERGCEREHDLLTHGHPFRDQGVGAADGSAGWSGAIRMESRIPWTSAWSAAV